MTVVHAATGNHALVMWVAAFGIVVGVAGVLIAFFRCHLGDRDATADAPQNPHGDQQ